MIQKQTRPEREQLDRALFKKLEQMTLKIPRDPSLYASQVSEYTKMFQDQFIQLTSDTQRKNQRFGELVTFLARCSSYYPKSLTFLAPSVMDLLNTYGPILHHYNRRKAVGCIFILRAKNLLFPVATFEFLMKLLNLEDKTLRRAIYKYVLNDLKRMNKHHRNQKINQSIKTFIQSYINSHSDKCAQKLIQVMIQMYKRNIWTDNRSVNIIAQGCLNKSSKIKLLAAYFLLSTTEKLQEIPESSDSEPQVKKLKGVTKDTRTKQKSQLKQKKKHARKLRRKQISVQRNNFMPIDVLYSPQQFCEKLFVIASGKEQKFAYRLVFMSLIGRMIWRHSLILLPFYGFLIKYMQPHQKQVHRVLAAFAEAVHDIVPDDDLQAVIKHIVEKFVNDKCSEFAMTIGLNTIRQVGAKMPSLLTEELLLYLCTYYDYKNKNVSNAAKSLINLVRSINPDLLQKKYRGKPGEIQDVGANKPKLVHSINGADLLPNNSQIPIQYDKILTDEDFKMIRKLKRKRDLQKENQNQQQIEQELQSDQEDGDGEDQSSNQEIDEQLIDFDAEQEVEQDSDQQNEDEDDIQLDQDGDQIEEVGDQQKEFGEEEDNEQSQLEWEDQEQVIQGTNQNKKRNHKQAFPSQDEEESDEDESQEDENPHGFIPLNRIAFYKKSKTQKKAEKKNLKDEQPKFKHQPKQKGGGTSNRQKQKLKPLMMLRSKKNKIRNRQKQVKTRIKDLKNKLGKIRSKSQAKKLKNKKVKTH